MKRTYEKAKFGKTNLRVNKSYEGESIEKKVQRIIENGEAITDGAPLIYTERKEGVLGSYNIRTDKWEVAIDAMDKITASAIAKRQGAVKENIQDESTQTTE